MEDNDTRRALGEDVMTTMPICYAVVNGNNSPVGFVGGSRIGDFMNAQVVLDPAKRKGWTFLRVCLLGEKKAHEEGVKVLVAAPMFYNQASRVILRWLKFRPIPVVMLVNQEAKAMLMGKVL